MHSLDSEDDISSFLQSLSIYPPQQLKAVSSPVTLFVQYQSNTLKFKFDCKAVKAEDYFYTRHILIVQAETFENSNEMFKLIEIYYNKLKLGDFIKILYTSKWIKNKWYEKTTQKLLKQQFCMDKQKNINLFKACKYAFSKAGQFTEPIVITILSNNANSITESTLRNLNKLQQNQQKTFIFNLFYKETYLQSKSLFKKLNIKLYKYNLMSFQDDLKSFFKGLHKIRIKHARIKLKCLGNRFFDYNKFVSNNNHWILDEEGAISKNFYHLNNQSTYIEEFNLKNNSGVMGFQVEFFLTLISNQKFQMRKQFHIIFEEETNNSHYFEALDEKSINTMYMYPYDCSNSLGVERKSVNISNLVIKKSIINEQQQLK